MSLIARLKENIVSRGLGQGRGLPDAKEACETIAISLEQVVTVEEEEYPLTGSYSGVKGWSWNKTVAQSLDRIQNRIETSVGGYLDNLDEGTISTDWYGSALSGLKLAEIKEFQDKTKRVGWKPEITKGSYSIFHKSKALNSKACYSETLSEELLLKEECLENSIQINLFKRDNSLNNIPYVQYKYNEILREKYSFYINEESTLISSEVYSKKIGTSNIDIESIECHSEYLGVGRASRTLCYTEYFPCKNVSIATISDGQVVIWSEVDSFKESSEDDKHYIVDALKGLVSFPKKVSETAYYVKSDNGNSIEFFQDLELLEESGTLKIENEEIEYHSKGKYKVYLPREREISTTLGAQAFEVQKGYHLRSDDHIYANYDAVPRVDYDLLEETFDDKKINLKPYKKINSNGVLELNIDERHVNKIKITCDKPNIVENIFGTLHLQSDASKITAEVLNSNNKPVEEIKVTFESTEGNFEGIVPTITKVTNLDGEANTSYSYEYTNNSLSTFGNPEHINGSSYFEAGEMPPGITVEDITIFQSLKIDPFEGSLGRDYSVIDVERIENSTFLKVAVEEKVLEPTEYKTMYTQQYAAEDRSGYSRGQDINQELPLEGYYNYGLAVFNFEGMIKKSSIIRSVENNEIIVEGINSISVPDKITLFKRGELKYSPNNDYSHDRLSYTYDAVSEVYKPLRPTRIVGQRIYFDNILIPKGNPVDDKKIIAGYKLFFAKLMTLKASAVNPGTGFLIVSNEIRMKVDFPPYLKGSNGFTFISEEDSEGSALGGANFLTVNPEIPNVLNIIVE